MADVLEVLRKERDRLDRAIAVLEGTVPRRGRPPAAASSAAGAAAPKNGRKKKAKRTMSPEARARISAMMKKRWADRRKAAKKGAKAAS